MISVNDLLSLLIMCPGSAQAAALRAEAMRWQEALDSRAFLEAQVRSRTRGA